MRKSERERESESGRERGGEEREFYILALPIFATAGSHLYTHCHSLSSTSRCTTQRTESGLPIIVSECVAVRPTVANPITIEG